MNTQTLILHCLQASILGTVFSYGLQATVSDALFLVRHPGLLLRSVLAIFIIMPLVAIAMVDVFALPRATEIALVVLALAPIPPLLPKKESKAGGEGAYALGLMVVMGMLAILLAILLVPLLAGMVVRIVAPALARKLARPIELASLVLLLAAAAPVLFAAMPIVVNLLHSGTLLAIVAFIMIGLAVGQLLARAVAQRQTVLALSTASRHPAIALAVAKTNFPDEPFLAATIVLYLLVVTLLAIPYITWRRRMESPASGRSAQG
ncbi:hypothetical protein [Stenotrophomonas sp.]|uniref:hypothetical protein n=1 Tax=Stenotrophomonas sp. TaxID=69392 RepID=UPI0029AB4D20|nr:hypothetical protein [Stenotrophomonas sp.]MDX3933873.1 hypothetical protein [Stenotrophomonas sp.]